MTMYDGAASRAREPAAAGRRFTVALSSDSLESVLEAISLVLDLSYVRVGDTVTLYPNP